MSDKLVKLRKTVLEEQHFGYEVKSYEDVTSITYF
jgi:hypothetical protein